MRLASNPLTRNVALKYRFLANLDENSCMLFSNAFMRVRASSIELCQLSESLSNAFHSCSKSWTHSRRSAFDEARSFAPLMSSRSVTPFSSSSSLELEFGLHK